MTTGNWLQREIKQTSNNKATKQQSNKATKQQQQNHKATTKQKFIWTNISKTNTSKNKLFYRFFPEKKKNPDLIKFWKL